MNVLLIHPPVRENALPNNIPLGTLYTAAALREAAIDFQVLDLNERRWADSMIESFIFHGGFTHVGISSIASQYRWVEKLVAMVHRIAYGVPVIIGGPISVLGEKLCEWLGSDVFVYQGESELEFPGYLKDKTYASQPVYRAGVIENLDSLPSPFWNGCNMSAYVRNPVGAVNRHKWDGGRRGGEVALSANLLWTRGCPHKCSYCAHDFLGSNYRKRSPGAIVAEMEMLRRLYGARYFHTSDDNSMADRAWLGAVCDAIMSSKELQGCTWGCAGRVDRCDVETLMMMKKAGCVLVGLGVESGSQKMLDAYNKGVTVEQIEAAISACKTVFGGADYSVMVGGPGESEVTVRETIDLCRRTKTRPEVVFFTTPLPGAALYEYALKDNLIPDERAYVKGLGEMGEQIAANVSGQTDAWLFDAKRRIVQETFKGESLI